MKRMLNRLNHVAIAVADLEAASKFYRDVLGAEVSEPKDLLDHGVTSVFVHLSNTKLELLAPLGDNSPIAGYLTKHPSGGLHHLCFEVDDIQEAINDLKNHGMNILHDPKIGSRGRLVIFTHPKDSFGCLLEFEESS